MTKYEVEVSATAEKQIRKLEKVDQVRVLKAVAALASEPHPAGCRKLRGFDDVYRIRVEVLRVIYNVADRRLIVIVLKIGHRRDVYR